MQPTLTRLMRDLRRHAAQPDDASDAELLGRFAQQRDQDAFTALVARHGQMVLSVCRRVLGDAHAAEDAFQAVFLVLARKAAALRRPAALGAWLYGVAYRVSLKARRHAHSRPRSIQSSTGIPERVDPRPDPLAALTARDLLAELEAEVQRLPEVYRLPWPCAVSMVSRRRKLRSGWAGRPAPSRAAWSAGGNACMPGLPGAA